MRGTKNGSGTKNGVVVWTVAVATALGLVATAPGSVRAQGFGLATGLNFMDDSEIDAGSSSATYDNSTGHHFGVEFEIGGGPIAVRPGLYYQRFGTYSFPSGEEFELTAVEIPVDVRLSILPVPFLDPYLVGGPVFTFPRDEEGFEDATESVVVTADVGVGLDLGIPGTGIRLMPELRYSIGVTDYLSDSFEVGGVTFEPSEDERRVADVMLRLHVMF